MPAKAEGAITGNIKQLFASGLQPDNLPAIQPLFQHRIWQRMALGDGPTGSPTSSSSRGARTAAST